MTAAKIEAIDGFAEKSSTKIAAGLKERWSDIQHMMTLYKNIEETQSTPTNIDSPISGKVVMFTGTLSVSRKKMIDEAKDLGAVIRKSVSGKLDFLVVGEEAGQSKITKAEKLNVEMITEEEYRKRLQ